MPPYIRIVVRGRAPPHDEVPANTCILVKTVKPVPSMQLVQPPRSKRGNLALLRQGVDIALEYFNSDDAITVSALTIKARNWADRYFKGYPYASKRPTALLQTFPNLFNLRVASHRRLVPRIMAPQSSPEPEGASPRELRRAERRAMNSESFPEFAEPTLASESEIDQIVHLQAQRTSATAKPTMRVDASMLRGSGLLNTLPEFLGQLARANLETETMLATDPNAVRIELDDEQAASQQHVEMNLYSGLMEAQRRRHQQRIVLPGDLAVKPTNTTETDSSEHEGSAGNQQTGRQSSSDEEDSGDESDASTSTTASLRANQKKRKAEDDDEEFESDSPPNKIRLDYHYPTSKLRYYDMKRRKLVSKRNPDAVPDDPFENLADQPTSTTADKSVTVAERPSSSSSNSSNKSSSSTRSVPITRIRVPSRSPDGSRSASPDRIIVLRHPVVPQSSRENSASEDGGSPRRRTKIKVVQKGSREVEKRKLIEEVD